jgi:hypothetical protein
VRALLLLTLLIAVSAQAQDADVARRLDEAREAIRQERVALMPDAIRYLARNSRSVDDQLLILAQVNFFDSATRQEVSRQAVYMDPKAEHLRAVRGACRSFFPESRLVCVYVASRVSGDEADQLLLGAALSGDRMTAPMAAQALSSRSLRREDAERLEHVFDSEPGDSWNLALNALCSSMDMDRSSRIRNRIDRAKAIDTRLLYDRLYGDPPARRGTCNSDGGVHPSP